MTTNPTAIKHLWTHKTQDHAWLPDEDLVVDRAEGVGVAEQTVRLAYYPTTRQFSNRPAAELAAKLATLTPGDLDYTMFAVSGSEANERAMQMARHYWLARGKTNKHKLVDIVSASIGELEGELTR